MSPARAGVLRVASALMLLFAVQAAARERVEMPLDRGVPVAVLALQLPAGSLGEGERAVAEIEFTVDLRGRVIESRLLAASAPALGDTLLEQHRQWVYAVATRNDECTAKRFRAVQRIAVERKDGKLRMDLQPAEVIELIEGVRFDQIASSTLVPNYRAVIGRIGYPRSALLRNVEASFALLIDIDADGKVTGAYPINAAYDEYGFVHSAVKQARLLQADAALTQGRPFTACVPIQFRLR